MLYLALLLSAGLFLFIVETGSYIACPEQSSGGLNPVN